MIGFETQSNQATGRKERENNTLRKELPRSHELAVQQDFLLHIEYVIMIGDFVTSGETWMDNLYCFLGKILVKPLYPEYLLIRNNEKIMEQAIFIA